MIILIIKTIGILQKFLEKIELKLLQFQTTEHFFPQLKRNTFLLANSQAVYLKKFQSKASTVHGMVSDREAERLFLLSVSQELTGDVLEIGSWVGKSTAYLALGCKVSNNGMVKAVDTFQGTVGKERIFTKILAEDETILDRFHKNMGDFNLSEYVQAYPMTSQVAAEQLKQKFRLMFIDGSHEFQSVKTDINIWTPKLKKNGLLIFHDFVPSFPGVVKAVTSFIIRSKKFQVLTVADALLIARKVK